MSSNILFLEIYCLMLQLGLFVGLWIIFGKIGYLALREIDGSMYNEYYTIHDDDAVFISYILGPVSLLALTTLYLFGRCLQFRIFLRERIAKKKQKKKIKPNWDI